MNFKIIATIICIIAVQSVNAQRFIYIGEKQDKEVDIKEFQVVVKPDAYLIDFMNIPESTLIRFLKGEVDFIDPAKKMIYRCSNEVDMGELANNLKIAAKNAAIDEVFRAFEDRMNHPGPLRPSKSADDLTPSEIEQYNTAKAKFEAEDKPRVERVRGLLEHIKELGFPEEAEFIKRQLNQRKNANKSWMDRQPVNIIRQTIN